MIKETTHSLASENTYIVLSSLSYVQRLIVHRANVLLLQLRHFFPCSKCHLPHKRAGEEKRLIPIVLFLVFCLGLYLLLLSKNAPGSACSSRTLIHSEILRKNLLILRRNIFRHVILFSYSDGSRELR